MNARPPHTDAGAYALGLLEDRDRRAFEAHLAACAACREDLGALRAPARALQALAPLPTPPVSSARVRPGAGRSRRGAGSVRGGVEGRAGGARPADRPRVIKAPDRFTPWHGRGPRLGR
ncbi:zf-HC2 domain-containing protein [Actinomadura roseirufa]|uniref:zf-HC2 domain-containing protein n=1 Tax=Actinomadura roseirufa TaxID=2094049 RepID=UPI00104172BF|nr:zf-HC2 domain-containing protein [Actinomadura roseirufa]